MENKGDTGAGGWEGKAQGKRGWAMEDQPGHIWQGVSQVWGWGPRMVLQGLRPHPRVWKDALQQVV